MIYLRRWNWLWLLPCAVLWLRPNAAAAQFGAPIGAQIAEMTQTETDCVASAAEEIIQHNKMFRKTFDETVRQDREQRCSPEEAKQGIPRTHAVQTLMPTLEQAMQPKLEACFSANMARMKDVSNYIYAVTIMPLISSMPTPFCLTETEKECVMNVADETIQHNKMFRRTFDETVRKVRDQRCSSHEPELISPESQAFLLLENVLPQAAQPKLAACFAANPARMQHVNGSVNFVLSNKLKQSLPEPVCP